MLALAACASRGGDEIVDDGYQSGATLSDDATDEAGEFVVNQALLRQARDELAVLSQPASGGYLETLAASRAPRPVNDASPSTAAPASQGPGGAQTWADIEAGRGAPLPASATPAAPAAVVGTGPTMAAEATTVPVATATAATAPAVDSSVNPVNPAAPVSPPTETGTTSPTATPIAETVAPVAVAPTPRLPGPGEPGYIVSGHSTGTMSLAPLAAVDPSVLQPASATDATSAAPATQDAAPAGSSFASRPTLAEAEVGSSAIPPVVVAGNPSQSPPSGNVIVTPIGNAVQGNPQMGNGAASSRSAAPEAPTMTAALRQPATNELPAVADVPPLDRTTLERGGFATLMGAMHGMVERCEPPTQMRDQALKTYRATYPAVDLDRNERDNPAARLRFDEEFARSAAATLGSNRVNCDYVRSQSYGWNQLVGDLRHMNRDSARQYRPGLITEISRGAGVGNY